MLYYSYGTGRDGGVQLPHLQYSGTNMHGELLRRLGDKHGDRLRMLHGTNEGQTNLPWPYPLTEYPSQAELPPGKT